MTKPILNVKTRVGGSFTEFRIRNVDTGEERVIPGPKNRVVDSGLDMFAVDTTQEALGRLYLSTSNSLVSDSTTVVPGTSVFATARSGWAIENNTTAPPLYVSKEVTFTFALGAATGNWSSLYVTRGVSPFLVFAGALILDGEGDPASLTVAENEILSVVYQLRIYAPNTDRVASFAVGSPAVTTEITGRVASLGAWAGGTGAGAGGLNAEFAEATIYRPPSVLGSITGAPSVPSGLSPEVAGAITRGTYSPGSHYLDHTVSLSYLVGNLDGGLATLLLRANLGAVYNQYMGTKAYQLSFNPPIAKDNTKNFAITVRHSWGRW